MASGFWSAIGQHVSQPCLYLLTFHPLRSACAGFLALARRYVARQLARGMGPSSRNVTAPSPPATRTRARFASGARWETSARNPNTTRRTTRSSAPWRSMEGRRTRRRPPPVVNLAGTIRVRDMGRALDPCTTRYMVDTVSRILLLGGYSAWSGRARGCPQATSGRWSIIAEELFPVAADGRLEGLRPCRG